MNILKKYRTRKALSHLKNAMNDLSIVVYHLFLDKGNYTAKMHRLEDEKENGLKKAMAAAKEKRFPQAKLALREAADCITEHIICKDSLQRLEMEENEYKKLRRTLEGEYTGLQIAKIKGNYKVSFEKITKVIKETEKRVSVRDPAVLFVKDEMDTLVRQKESFAYVDKFFAEEDVQLPDLSKYRDYPEFKNVYEFVLKLEETEKNGGDSKI